MLLTCRLDIYEKNVPIAGGPFISINKGFYHMNLQLLQCFAVYCVSTKPQQPYDFEMSDKQNVILAYICSLLPYDIFYKNIACSRWALFTYWFIGLKNRLHFDICLIYWHQESELILHYGISKCIYRF